MKKISYRINTYMIRVIWGRGRNHPKLYANKHTELIWETIKLVNAVISGNKVKIKRDFNLITLYYFIISFCI